MEMLLRPVDYSEVMVKVRWPKKVFMDDVTLLMEKKEMMEKVLKRLDDLYHIVSNTLQSEEIAEPHVCERSSKTGEILDSR